MPRSEVAIDLGALRRNARTLLRALEGAELWAVVKADAYSHGAVDCATAALGAGATGLCVATVAEALELRREVLGVRIVVMGPTTSREIAAARDADVELVVGEEVPEGVRVHVKLDTGMGRWGISELVDQPGRDVVGLMTHLATADRDLDFARTQLERFRAATSAYAELTRHAANSAAALRLPEARFDAARCGIALYGLSPWGDPVPELEPVLSWTSEVALSKELHPGDSTGYGREFLVDQSTWIGIVPVGYADGFRRDMTGTEIRVAGERRRVVGVVSMDALAVELDRDLPPGTPVTLVGPGLPIEEHARIADTITYEVVRGIRTDPRRARRVVLDS